MWKQQQFLNSFWLAGAISVVVIQPAWAQVVRVTGVELKPTPSGLQVILQTADGTSPQVFTSRAGETLILNVSNAQLQLPSGNEFRQNNPAAGIAALTVTNLSANSIQVKLTGKAGLPQVQVLESETGLMFSVTPAPSTAEKPETQLESEPEETEAEQQEEIELVVTATRTEEELTNVPRSVTVITREQIEEQTRFTRNLNDILARTVPGFGPPTNRTNTFGQTLRGRSISVLIDGIPQNTNLGSIPAQLTTIDPEAIERIEVVRGPNAIYGAQATGGLINIITRRPSEERLTSTTEIGLNNSLTNAADSFGYNLQHSISGTEDQFDYTASFSIATTGGFFDAEGDRIPSDLVNADLTQLNGLLKFGVNLDDQQRLQLTFNHFDQYQDTAFISEPSVFDIPGIQKARAIRIPEGTTVIGGEDAAFLTTTNTTLSYTHENLWGSRLQGQLFYRNYSFGGGIPSDLRDTIFGFISQSPGESEQLGGRLQIETPFNAQETVSLLWGVDYVTENSSQNFNIFDPNEFDASGGRIYRKINEMTFVPAYEFDDLGVFAQLQWEISDRLTFSGGARYVNLDISTDDYTTFSGNNIAGGSINADDFVFNAGVIYNVTDELSLFTSFSQGFSFPDIGRVLRQASQGFAVGSSIDLTAPQKVDNYEIGMRGNWNSVQVSLAGFFNYSDLGLGFEAIPGGPLRTIRAPQRVYGIEASLDWQPGERWQLGGTATWLEGENDEERDGDYIALNSITIPPLKLTAYVEHETLPGWRNRLQLLYSGDRDRAFEDDVDGAPIESYVTVDYISSIQLGSGELLIGVQNLFNEQYFPVFAQYFAPFDDSSNYAGQGRTLSVGYRITW
ncbi:TonB-dependent receptor [Chroococcidiopsis sp. CCMEE 29]|uniref:TonB-dependent receptor domain-containing protein n=1 Tax=Chroococcidiopsis sp. CCMEE 29 TaxID=155894 RepID=UPI00201FF4E2|nr:TonB-dependent receptor [Chroococcidiopsis sp. CCMEE 29]